MCGESRTIVNRVWNFASSGEIGISQVMYWG